MRSRLFSAKRALEHSGQVFGRYSLARVGDLDAGHIAFRRPAQGYGAAGWGVAHGVGDEVREHGIYVGRDLSEQAYALPLRLRLEARDGVGDHVVQRGFFEREFQHPGVYPGELEEVVDEAAKVFEFAAGGREVASLGLRIFGDAIREGLYEGPGRGERCSQVVGDGGDEVAPRLLHLSLSLRRPLHRPRHPVEVGGEPRDLIVSFDLNLRAELTADYTLRSGTHALDAARQRHGVEEAEADGEDRGEGQHREQQGQVVARDEHRPRAGEHHPEQEEATDQAGPYELRPHAAETAEHDGTDE